MSERSPADWYPDPFGRHEARYWDGGQWTEHVASQGLQSVDLPVGATLSPVGVPTKSSADWYLDPFGRFERRYWDGIRWTEHVVSQGVQRLDLPVEIAPIVVSPQTQAGWYADPTGARGRRFWDGDQWTHHVDRDETKGADPRVDPVPPPAADRPNKKVERQVRKVGVGGGPVGGGTLFTEQVLVVNQTGKRSGPTLGYSVHDQHGRQLGTVQQDPTPRSSNKRRRRQETNRTDRHQVVDLNGRVLLAMTRPELGSRSKPTMVVEGPGNTPIGHITKETSGLVGGIATLAHTGMSVFLEPTNFWGHNGVARTARKGIGGARGFVAAEALSASGVADRLSSPPEGLDKIGHVRFGLEANGQRLGSIHAESIEQVDFSIRDPAGTEIGRITRTSAGRAKMRSTKADGYVVQMHRPLKDPLRSLVVAAAVVLDLELTQRGG